MTLALSLACAVCARDADPAAPFLIAAMLAVPYAVAAVVLRAIRRSGAGSDET